MGSRERKGARRASLNGDVVLELHDDFLTDQSLEKGEKQL